MNDERSILDHEMMLEMSMHMFPIPLYSLKNTCCYQKDIFQDLGKIWLLEK